MKTAFSKNSLSWRAVCAVLSASLFASACAGKDRLPDDPFEGAGPALTMVVVNHADRYGHVFVDQYWAGNIGRRHQDGRPAGGGGGACCYPGLKDWSKPVTVSWIWGYERDKATGEITRPNEQHTAVVHFPPGGPKRSDDMYKDEAELCVILRDIDKVELAFSIGGTNCITK
jgi:hypothetical protein